MLWRKRTWAIYAKKARCEARLLRGEQVVWYRKATTQGLADAQNNLSDLQFIRSRPRCEARLLRGEQVLARGVAAEQGQYHSQQNAQFVLAQCHERGAGE
jgi:TPR repeat protein